MVDSFLKPFPNMKNFSPNSIPDENRTYNFLTIDFISYDAKENAKIRRSIEVVYEKLCKQAGKQATIRYNATTCYSCSLSSTVTHSFCVYIQKILKLLCGCTNIFCCLVFFLPFCIEIVYLALCVPL